MLRVKIVFLLDAQQILDHTTKTESLYSAVQSEFHKGRSVVSAINSAQTPANERLSGNKTVFCLMLSLMSPPLPQ